MTDLRMEPVDGDANEDGVRFAAARGFVEVERYVLDGETDLWLTLRLESSTA